MILEFEDEFGENIRCASELEINGTTFYIATGKKVYVKDESGKFVPYTETGEESKILEHYLEEAKSLDIIYEDEER